MEETEETSKTTSKAPIERSKSYPGASLAQCVEYAKAIQKGLGGGAHDREALAKAMGFKSLSGPASHKMSALSQFGLLVKAGNGFALSELAKTILNPLSDDELRTNLKKAFQQPPLYTQLLERFQGDGRIPEQLTIHLHRNHGITADASPLAAKVFLESGTYAGVIGTDRSLSERVGTKDETAPEADSTIPDARTASTRIPPAPGQQQFRIALSGGQFADLRVPATLNAKDLKIIRSQVDILELQLSEDAGNS